MKTKKPLSTIISLIILISPISSAVRPKNMVFTGKTSESFVDDYLQIGSHIPTLGFSSATQLISYLKYDIKHNKNLNNIKECYYNNFKTSLYKNFIKDNEESEQIDDIFIFFFSYIVIGIIAEELHHPTIDFKVLKQIFKYLHGEDMHFLYYAYLIANSHPYLNSTKIYIDHAIKNIAQTGKEKPVKTTEDLIHKTFRKDSKNKNTINILKNVYDESLTDFNKFFEKNLNTLTFPQKSILEIIIGIISNYKKRGNPANAIDLYNKYFKEAYPGANPR
ncbi:MAG: hypothetical protein IJI84_04765 [Clostridia bacterium]|nr:hypothetical protein [Clostridia bacterium]